MEGMMDGDLSVVDHGGNDGRRPMVSSRGDSLQVAHPVVSLLMAEHFEGPSLLTSAVSVIQCVVDVQIEQTVSLAVSTIKLHVDIDALALGVAEDSLHVINSDAQFSSLGSVLGILVLDTDVNTIQIE